MPEGLAVGVVSDHDEEIIDAPGVRDDVEDIGSDRLAKRAVFVVDDERTVTRRWVADDPDSEAVENAAAEAG